MPKPSTIAIDGPAGAGKSALSSTLANVLGYVYVDTGAIYRALTLVALDRGVDLADGTALAALAGSLDIELLPPSTQDGRQYTVLVDGKDVTWSLFTPEVDARVSSVAAHPAVRDAVLPVQRRVGRGRVVMAGRDIGTVVLPAADLKIYLDASPVVRAQRRQQQLRSRGVAADLATVLADLRRRDDLDTSRSVAPLRAAPDAVVVATDNLTFDEEVKRVLDLISEMDC